jgi:hypothetical protein
MVMGKRMEDHLRFAVAYWHSFAWPGGDPFGGQTFDGPGSATRWNWPAQGRCRLRDVRISACPSSASMTPTCAPKARAFAENTKPG